MQAPHPIAKYCSPTRALDTVAAPLQGSVSLMREGHPRYNRREVSHNAQSGFVFGPWDRDR